MRFTPLIFSLLVFCSGFTLAEPTATSSKTVPVAEASKSAKSLSQISCPIPDFGGFYSFDLMISANNPEAQAYVVSGFHALLGWWDAEAYRQFKIATELDPDCLMAQLGLFLSLAANHEYQAERMAAWQKALELRKKSDAATGQEIAYVDAIEPLLARDVKKSAEQFSKIGETYKNDPISQLFTAIFSQNSYNTNGDPNMGMLHAFEISNKLITKHPEKALFHLFRATIEERTPNPKIAFLTSQKAAELAPNYPPAQMVFGHFASRVGQLDLAEKAFQKAIETHEAWTAKTKFSFPDDDFLLRAKHYLALVQFRMGKEDDALDLAFQMRRIQPDNARPLSPGNEELFWGIWTLEARLLVFSKEKRRWDRALLSLQQSDPAQKNLTKENYTVLETYYQALREYCRGQLALENFKKEEALQHLSNLTQFGDALLSATSPQAKKTAATSQCFRAVRLLNLLSLELKARITQQTLDKATSADFTESRLKDIIDQDQDIPIIRAPLLVMPPELWLIDHYLSKNEAQKAKEVCQKALEKTPNLPALLQREKSIEIRTAKAKQP